MRWIEWRHECLLRHMFELFLDKLTNWASLKTRRKTSSLAFTTFTWGATSSMMSQVKNWEFSWNKFRRKSKEKKLWRKYEKKFQTYFKHHLQTPHPPVTLEKFSSTSELNYDGIAFVKTIKFLIEASLVLLTDFQCLQWSLGKFDTSESIWSVLSW